MKIVDPIRDRKKITQIKNLLQGQNRYRDLSLFVLGINTALRISDLLKLQINQFIEDDGKIRNRFGSRNRRGASAMRLRSIKMIEKLCLNISRHIRLF